MRHPPHRSGALRGPGAIRSLSRAALCLIATGHSAATHADEVGASVQSAGSMDLAPHPNSHSMEWWTLAEMHARGAAGDGRWEIGAQLEHHRLWGTAPISGASVRASQTGWSGPVGPLHLKLGHTRERWGRLDMLPVVDVLNGRDLRRGPVGGLTAEPTPLIRLGAGSKSARVQLTVLPIGAQNRVAWTGSDWALFGPGMLANSAADAATWPGGDALSEESAQALLASVATGLEDAQSTHTLSAGLSGGGAPRPDAGIRLEGNAGRWDAALIGAWIRARTPLPSLAPALVDALQRATLPGISDLDPLTDAASAPLALTRPRSAVIGGELSTVLGGVGLRAEGAWQSAKPVPRAWLQGSTSPSVAAGLGIDWSAAGRLIVSAEGRWEHLMDPPEDALLWRGSGLQFAAGVRLSMAQERLWLEPVALFQPEDAAWLVRPGVRWRPSDQWEVAADLLALGGAQAPPADLFEALAYTGGPLSYWGANDAASVALRWIR